VPGVVEMVYQRRIKSPPFLSDERAKYLTRLRQSGRPFLGIDTLQQMLETAFDVLEVLRFLRYKRQILHRDISEGNVMYVEEVMEETSSTTGAVDAGSVGVDGINVTGEVPLCFIKYLLRESNDPRKTSVLLIDFNRAELLTGKGGPQYQRTVGVILSFLMKYLSCNVARVHLSIWRVPLNMELQCHSHATNISSPGCLAVQSATLRNTRTESRNSRLRGRNFV